MDNEEKNSKKRTLTGWCLFSLAIRETPIKLR